MSFLRSISTQRLLALLAAAVLMAAGGTAIALAATGGGPKPPPKPLDAAVRDALNGPEMRGVSARVQFTNHLLGSAGIEGTAPLLNGATGRLWVSKDHLRLELQSEQGDSQVVLDRRSFWVYDVSSHTVYRGRLPAHAKVEPPGKRHDHAPSLADVRDAIAQVMRQAILSDATPTDVAGHPAYDVRITPKNGGLVGAVRLAWDATHGVPLRVAVFARGSSSPVLELKATDISYGPVPASTFAVSPPKGAKVVDFTPRDLHGSNRKEGRKRHEVSGRGAVSHALPFKLVTPSTLAGQLLSEVHLVGSDAHKGALATYGRGLGGIAVLEREADASRSPSAHRGEHGGLSIPSVRVGGVTTEELVTPLGTMVRFDSGGVSYVVVGSITKADAEAAVKGLLP